MRALELARSAKAAMKAAKILQDAGKRACAQEGRPGRQIEGRSRGPEGSCQLEDLSVCMMEKAKTTKKAARHTATGRLMEIGYRVSNFHLESNAKMDEETALQKAREMKAETIGISTRPKIYLAIICADRDSNPSLGVGNA